MVQVVETSLRENDAAKTRDAQHSLAAMMDFTLQRINISRLLP